MPRFTISRHTGSKEGDHFDLLLEQGEMLKTWRLQNTAFQSVQTALQIEDHRKLYLDYEGEIAGRRGRVTIWETGSYTIDEWKSNHVQVALVGRQLRTRVLLQCKVEGGAPWTLIDPAHEIRKSAATFLRGAELEEPPTDELATLRIALSREEQKILAQVGQFTRGGEVDWSLAVTDTSLYKSIESARARWQHPWLAAAKAYFDRLAELSSQILKRRPGASP